MVSLIEIFKKKFNHQLKTLKEISFDKDNKETLVSIYDKHFSFDNIVDEYFGGKEHNRVQKFDAIIFKNDKIYCIEFKNSTPRKINNKEVKSKASEGYASLSKICHDEMICLKKYKLFYLVIYKTPNIEPNRNKIGNELIKNKIKFGLEKYKGKFYEDVETIDNKEFEMFYLNLNRLS